jgi:hypothetical protein
MDTNLMIAGLVVLALIAVAAWLLMRKKESKNLEKNFGPEYNRTVEEMGSRDKAEAELKARKKRVEQLHITPLAPAEAEQFSQSWRALQARFVDDPKVALAEADALVGQLMQKRGYPMGDFERRAADISVDHPAVVHHYRVAHDIARRGRDGEVDTETMRQAVIHYRALFSELLEVEEPRPAHQADTTHTTETTHEAGAMRVDPRDRKNMETQS